MPKKPQKKIVGARLIALMAERQVRDSPLARSVGVSPSQIKRWKNDEQGAMPDAVRALANYFDVSEAFLYGLDTDDLREQLAREVGRGLGQPEADIIRALGALPESQRYEIVGRLLERIETMVAVPATSGRDGAGSASLMRRDAGGAGLALEHSSNQGRQAKTAPSPLRTTKT